MIKSIMHLQKKTLLISLIAITAITLSYTAKTIYAQITKSNCVDTAVGSPRDPAVMPEGCQSTSACSGPAQGELSTAEYKAIYGNSAKEVEANLVTINFQGKSIRVHKKVQSVFEQVNKEITQANTGYKFKSIGTFAWRTKNCPGGCSGLSTHSFGITMDINPATNPYTTSMTHDIPQAVADIFKKNGFAWGGDWKVHDWMHFQFEGKCQ